MRFVLPVLLVLAAPLAHAQLSLPVGPSQLFPQVSGACPTGPLDISAGAFGAYSQRALSSALCGTPLYTIRRDSDNATQSFNSNAAGNAPSSSIASFIGAAKGYGSIWNDQSSSGNDVKGISFEGIPANNTEPLWVNASIGSIPVFDFANAVGQGSLSTDHNLTFPTGGYTYFAVVKSNSGFGTTFESICGTSNNVASEWLEFTLHETGGAGHLAVEGQSYDTSGNDIGGITVTSAGVVTGAYILVDVVFAKGTFEGRINGTVQTQSSSFDFGTLTAITNLPFWVGDNGIGSAQAFDGIIVELIAYPSALGSTTRSNIRSNIAAYYGITLH